ncbi:MAG: hypothetical protein WCT40_03715 [Candidatus Magasanikbacteria bacterium]
MCGGNYYYSEEEERKWKEIEDARQRQAELDRAALKELHARLLAEDLSTPCPEATFHNGGLRLMMVVPGSSEQDIEFLFATMMANPLTMAQWNCLLKDDEAMVIINAVDLKPREPFASVRRNSLYTAITGKSVGADPVCAYANYDRSWGVSLPHTMMEHMKSVAADRNRRCYQDNVFLVIKVK